MRVKQMEPVAWRSKSNANSWSSATPGATQAHEVVPMAQGYLNDLATVDSGCHACLGARTHRRPPGVTSTSNRASSGAAGRNSTTQFPPMMRAPCWRCASAASSTSAATTSSHAGHLWEIDEFIGDNAGLVVAEIELSTVDEAFERPRLAWHRGHRRAALLQSGPGLAPLCAVARVTQRQAKPTARRRENTQCS